MLNTELKDGFVRQFSESESVRHRCYSVFARLGDFEDKLGKDVYEFTDREMTDVLAQTSGLRRSTQYQTIRIINEYLKWARSNGINVVCNTVSEGDEDVVQNYRKKMVFGVEHLSRLFSAIFGTSGGDGSYIIFRCYLWLAFVGIDFEDAYELRTRDVDTDYMRVLVKGREYPLYKESIPDFKSAKELTAFRLPNHLYPDKVTIVDREDGDRLLRRMKKATNADAGDPANTVGSTIRRYVRDAVCGKKLAVTNTLTYSNVKLSGLFYRMYLREEMGFPVDFKLIAEMDIANDDISGRRRIAKKSRIVAGYKEDYAVWKRAYELYRKDSHL